MDNQGSLQDVKVEVPGNHGRPVDPNKPRTKKKTTKPRGSEFVYVNNAYVGSMSSVNEVRTQAPPPTRFVFQFLEVFTTTTLETKLKITKNEFCFVQN